MSEEEIDAEIAKENAKYSGHPSSGMLSPGGSDHGTSVSPQELLRNFVQFGSKEYKHEFKKARDRLYKRKLRVLRTQGIMDNSAALDIPRADIEVEMLSRYTANKTVQAEMEKRDKESAATGETAETAPEPRSEGGVTSVLEEDLEPSLDNVVPGGGAAGVHGQEGAAQLPGGGAAGGQGAAAVHPSPVGVGTCEVCGEHNFTTPQQLHNHARKHKYWCCKKCGKSISGSTSLKAHKLRCSKEKNVPQFKCQICNHMSVSKYDAHSISNKASHL